MLNRTHCYIASLMHTLYISDLHGVRFLIAMAEFSWGLSFLLHPAEFHSGIYGTLLTAMPTESWALVFLLFSITQIALIATGDYHDRIPVVFAGWTALLWWFMVVSMSLGVDAGIGVLCSTYPIAISAGWVFIRSGVTPNIDRRIKDYGLRDI